VAIVSKASGVIWKEVIPTARLAEVVGELSSINNVTTVVVGDRTSHTEALKALAGLTANGKQLTIIPVDEHRSSDEARSRYWRDHPPRGLSRLVPLGLQVPPVPVDDYVAVILAERFFHKCKNKP